jgi:CII-binding regulator of phage lambda lysogenization HflD
MSKVRKALIAAAGAAAAALVTSYAKTSKLDAAAVGIALGAAVVAGWAAWRVPNAPADPKAS